MLLLIALAFPCDPQGAADTLVANPDRDHYLCLARSPQGADAIVAELAGAGADPRGAEAIPRLQRALALWMLERADEPMDPELLARIGVSDRRLLEDGIHARRGRPSPAPAHASVFAQFGYVSDPKYTDGRLRPVDRENLALLRSAPVVAAAPAGLPGAGAPAPEGSPGAPAPEGSPGAPAPEGAPAAGRWGCATGEGRAGPLWTLAGLAAVYAGSRRRQS